MNLINLVNLVDLVNIVNLVNVTGGLSNGVSVLRHRYHGNHWRFDLGGDPRTIHLRTENLEIAECRYVMIVRATHCPNPLYHIQ